MKYINDFAEQLAHELAPNQRIKEFLRNTDVIGAYAETSVRSLIRRIVEPLKVSTGAVVSPELVSVDDKIPQIDVVVWQLNPLPSIFSAGEFGLIPRMSVVGVLEVKRSIYSAVREKISNILEKEDELTNPIKPKDRKITYSSLGVVCIKEKNSGDTILNKLIEDKRVVVLTEIDNNGDFSVKPDQVMILVNFLAALRMKARLMDGKIEINLAALEKKDAN